MLLMFFKHFVSLQNDFASGGVILYPYKTSYLVAEQFCIPTKPVSQWRGNFVSVQNELASSWSNFAPLQNEFASGGFVLQRCNFGKKSEKMR